MVCQELLSDYAKKYADEIASSVIFDHFKEREDRKKLIVDWFNHAHSMQDCAYPNCFEAFTTLWQAFNGWGEWITSQKKDRLWIDALILNSHLQEVFDNLLERDRQFAIMADLFRDQWPIFRSDKIHNSGITWFEGDRREVVEYYLNHGINEFAPECWNRHRADTENTPLDWPHTLSALYRVRNNLIHGGKARSKSNHYIVFSAFQVLLFFLDKGKFLS